jgi:hypothetical protein
MGDRSPGYANSDRRKPNQNLPIYQDDFISTLPAPASGHIFSAMKRIALAVSVLLLCSCQTTSFSPPTTDYAARADADMAKFTITDNNVYGFEPEGKFDPGSVAIWESRKDQDWTVYKVRPKQGGFDSADLTVDESGAIIRLQFFKVVRTSVGRRDVVEAVYQELKSKYKALQRIGNLDTADLSVYVADTEAEWKKHYVEYLQLMDEPNNLGAQSCWILQPHLHQIQALIKKDGAGASVTVDYQTKKYADALRDRPPAKPVLQAP